MSEVYDPSDVYQRRLEQSIERGIEAQQDIERVLPTDETEQTEQTEKPTTQSSDSPESPESPVSSESPDSTSTSMVEIDGQMYPAEDTEVVKGLFGNEVTMLTKEAYKRKLEKEREQRPEDIEKATTQFRERMSAPGVGLADAAVGVVNANYYAYSKLFGVQEPDTLKLPKFENEEAQIVRDLSSVVLPSLILSAPAVSTFQGIQTARVASQGSKLTRLTRLGQDIPFQRFAKTGLSAGIGALADGVAPTSAEDINATGQLKQMLPEWLGNYIPDSIAALEDDSPDVKRAKNIREGVLLSVGADLLIGLAKLAQAKFGIFRATRYIPENEKATFDFKLLNDEAAAVTTPEDVIITNANRRVTELAQLRDYNLSKSVNLDEPIFGYHDAFDDMEYGIITKAQGGVLEAAVDLVRINNNLETVYGRLGSVFTESALKYALDADEGAMVILRGLGVQLTEAGPYGYKASNGKYLSSKEIFEAGDNIAASLLEMDVDEMKRMLSAFQYVDGETEVKVLNSAGYSGVMKAIKGYMKEYASLDTYKAAAYAATSVAGQVSDLAEGARLMDGSIAVNRAREQILDRLEFLTQTKAQTSYIRGYLLNMLNEKNRSFWRKGVDSIGKALVPEELKGTFDNLQKGLRKRAYESKQFMETLRNVQKERPELLDPLMLAYEVTDGNVDSMTKLNKYIQRTSASLSKLIFDRTPETSSLWVQGVWGNIYNSALSSFATPLTASASNAILLFERPIATFAGAIMGGKKEVLARSLYQYGAFVDTFMGAYKHMNEVYKRVTKDPTEVAYVMRDDIAIKNEQSLEVHRKFADAQIEKGNYGPAVYVAHVEELQALERHPWLRFGPNAMTAFDGFTRSFIGHIEARGRAFDEFNPMAKPMTKGEKVDLAEKYYRQMFDKNGMITDKAVEYASREIAMNLDDPFTQGVSSLISTLPVIKPFVMFPRTSSNMLLFAASHNPFGLLPATKFHEGFSKFSRPFTQMSRNEVEELLNSRNIVFSDETIEVQYETIRAEMRGRKAVASLAVTGASAMFLTNRLRGNGHYDKEVQRTRRENEWKPRTYKGFDGKWHTYDNMGAISDFVGLVADIGDNLVDGTLDANSGEMLFGKLTFILGSSVTNKSFMAGLEPLGDILSGNPAAFNRWGATFSSSFVPLSGARNDFARLLTPQLKVVEQELYQLLANRNPIMKDSLPNQYNYIDGRLVGVPDNVFQRIFNNWSPWKSHDDISPEQQYLIDIEYDGTPQLNTDGEGVDLPPEIKSKVAQLMGDPKGEQLFKKAIQRMMKQYPADQFRRGYKEMVRANPNAKVSDYQQVHLKLDAELRNAVDSALAQLDAGTQLEMRELKNKIRRTKNAVKRGDIEAARTNLY